MRILVFLALCAAAIVGVMRMERHDDVDDPADRYRLDWRSLADGSQIGTRTGDDAKIAVRCWDHRPDGMRCVFAARASGYPMKVVYLADIAERPDFAMGLSFPSGYSCQCTIDCEEVVRRHDDVLASSPLANRSRWSAADVDRMLGEPEIERALHFDCVPFLEAMQGADPAAIALVDVSGL